MTDTTTNIPELDPVEALRAQAREAAGLIHTLDTSTHAPSLRAGYREPFPWGSSSARDLVALLVRLANEPAPDPAGLGYGAQ